MGVRLHGLTFEYTENSGGAWTEIAETKIRSIEPGGLTKDMADDTNLGSTDMVREKSNSWKDPGQLSVVLKWSAADWKALYALFLKGPTSVPLQWRLTWPLQSGESTAAIWVCPGEITELTMSGDGRDNNDSQSINMTITLTGKPTLTDPT